MDHETRSRERTSGDGAMPAPATHLVMTEGGPILVVILGSDVERSVLQSELQRRGYEKFISWVVPSDDVREKYPDRFDVIATLLDADQPLRVLDYDGQRVFRSVSLERLGDQFRTEL